MPRDLTGPEVGDLLLRACHDLRTQLRAIRAHTELLVRSSTSHPSVPFIIEGAAKMDQFVDELSGYSLALRIVRESFVVTPLGVMLRTVLAKLGKLLTDSQAEVTCTELPRVSGDPDRLMQLFENLLLNSLRGQVSPRIQITADPHAEGWLFAVRDNGPEMDGADLERMFQPFARPSGRLALAICREIVERHAGRIWAESQPATGCTIFFTLPESQNGH